jgi:glutamate-ammonia-ligase adenylyltransferase
VRDAAAAGRWLAGLGLRDPEQARRDLRDLGRLGLPAAPLSRLLSGGPLRDALREAPDPGLALTGLERYLAAHPDRAGAVERLAGDPEAVRTLVGLGGSSRHLGEQLVREPALLDWLRARPGPRDRDAMVAELADRLDREAADDVAAARAVLRRYKARELARIALDDVRGTATLEETTGSLSALADACLEAAYRVARREAVARHGAPRDAFGRPVGFAVLALGKLGGGELNYSSDIDLIYVYEAEGRTDGPAAATNADHFARLGGTLARLLSDHTEDGQAYRVDLRLRPEGAQGALSRSRAATLAYYGTTARTWERQALLKARPVAGDRALGAALLAELAPVVHGRPLGASAIGDILLAKRRIEARAVAVSSSSSAAGGPGEFDVKAGVGGIRDVEFLVQFLQLLHGAGRPELRAGGTLAALDALAGAGAILPAEREALVAGYRFLRRVEHHVQAMFDLQTHRLPRDLEAQRVLAIRMGFAPASGWEDRDGPAQRFREALRLHARRVRSVYDRLLGEAFRASGTTASVDPVVDAVLGGGPADAIARRLAAGGFRQPAPLASRLAALAALAMPLRARHALATVLPRLVAQAARQDDPDAALEAILRVLAARRHPDRLWDRLRDRPRALCQWGARAMRDGGAPG